MWNISNDGGRIIFFKYAQLFLIFRACVSFTSILTKLMVNVQCASLIVSFDVDPTQRLTFWSTVIGGTFSTLTIFGIGQTSVQRYCSLPTLAQAKRYLSLF